MQLSNTVKQLETIPYLRFTFTLLSVILRYLQLKTSQKQNFLSTLANILQQRCNIYSALTNVKKTYTHAVQFSAQITLDAVYSLLAQFVFCRCGSMRTCLTQFLCRLLKTVENTKSSDEINKKQAQTVENSKSTDVFDSFYQLRKRAR